VISPVHQDRKLPTTPNTAQKSAQGVLKKKLSTRALDLLRKKEDEYSFQQDEVGVALQSSSSIQQDLSGGNSELGEKEMEKIAMFQARYEKKGDKRPRLDRNYHEMQEDHSYAGNVRENIKRFFKYNRSKLVREKLKVEEIEQKKARTWVLFLIIIQIIICVAYGFLITMLPQNLTTLFAAIVMGSYFFLKLGSVLGFTLQRWRKWLICCKSDYDPNDTEKYKEVFICIPSYNEGKEAFLRTIGSITNSNYPKEKLYMLFIVDGNKANSFENLMEVLLGQPWTEPVKSGTRVLESGVYAGVAWSVFLKEENRGKRDSQWLFVEIMRNLLPQFKPPFVFFVDSDTAFSPDSIRYLHDRLMSDKSQNVAGVCGQLQLSNFDYLSRESTFGQILFGLSNVFIVGFQLYEYHFNQILGKQAEAAYGSVTCLPGAFSMFRTQVLCDIEVEMDLTEPVDNRPKGTENAEGMTPFSFFYLTKVKDLLPLILNDFFSKPTIGIIDRNLYELGEDRTLTVRMLEQGMTCLYEPSAIAYTECPDSIKLFMLQRRRWNNSTFINLVMMVIRPKLWTQLKTIPIMVFALFDLVGAYLMPANAVLLMIYIWDPFFQVINDLAGTDLQASEIVAWWLIVQLVVIATTNMSSSDYFYVFNTFITGVLMAASLYFFIREIIVPVFIDFKENPAFNWPLFLLTIVFITLYLAVSIPSPLMFFTSTFYYLMLPTVSITLPLYSFLHLDDFSWGNR
jgi:cellulose synthase/poly-beta-1,6-N-acetylglucosamine synthase-like glycosyltransferase